MNSLIKKRILSSLSTSQIDIVTNINSNIMVTACPGSGKTRTLTRKLAYMNYSFPDSTGKIIAITYTNRAAKEISDRLEELQVESSEIWVGTIHQFCLDFILRKFGLINPRLSHGIKIIDEFTTNNYLQELCKSIGINYDRFNPPNVQINYKRKLIETDIKKRVVSKKYHEILSKNKEIDFGLILSISLKILEDNPVASQIIADSIRSIYIDEYQDTNEIQYLILAKLAQSKNNIKFMFVGDPDQAIFSNLGGVSKSKVEIETITGLNFETKILSGCYRSTQKIIDFYSKFKDDQYAIQSLAPHPNEAGIINYDKETHFTQLPHKISEIIQSSINKGIPESEICIVANSQFLLAPIAKQLKSLLPNVNFKSQDIYPIKPDHLNIFYKISFLTFTEPGRRTGFRKKIADEIIKILKHDFYVSFSEDFINLDLLDFINSIESKSQLGLEYLNEVITKLFFFLEITKNQHTELFQQKEDFFNKAQDRIDDKRLSINPELNSFRDVYRDKAGVNISTIHKIKGEEYEVIIAFGFLEGNVPHFTSKNKQSDAQKLLYVTFSRAKKELYIFAERGRKNYNYPEKQPTKLLDQVFCCDIF